MDSVWVIEIVKEGAYWRPICSCGEWEGCNRRNEGQAAADGAGHMRHVAAATSAASGEALIHLPSRVRKGARHTLCQILACFPEDGIKIGDRSTATCPDCLRLDEAASGEATEPELRGPDAAAIIAKAVTRLAFCMVNESANVEDVFAAEHQLAEALRAVHLERAGGSD